MSIEDVLRTIEENVGSIDAETVRGLDEYKTWKFEEALEILKARSELNDVAAQFAIANMYFNGQGIVAYDKKRARFWFQKAADQGFLPAAREFGYTVLSDQTIDEKLIDLAFSYLEKAAGSGDLQAKQIYVEESLKYIAVPHRIDTALVYIEDLKKSPKDSYDLKRYEDQTDQLKKLKKIFVRKNTQKILSTVFTVIGSVILACASIYAFLGLNRNLDIPVLNRLPLFRGGEILIFDRNVFAGMVMFAVSGLFVKAGDAYGRHPAAKYLLGAATVLTLALSASQIIIVRISEGSMMDDCFVYIGIAIIAFYVIGGSFGYSVKRAFDMKG